MRVRRHILRRVERPSTSRPTRCPSPVSSSSGSAAHRRSTHGRISSSKCVPRYPSSSNRASRNSDAPSARSTQSTKRGQCGGWNRERHPTLVCAPIRRPPTQSACAGRGEVIVPVVIVPVRRLQRREGDRLLHRDHHLAGRPAASLLENQRDCRLRRRQRGLLVRQIARRPHRRILGKSVQRQMSARRNRRQIRDRLPAAPRAETHIPPAEPAAASAPARPAIRPAPPPATAAQAPPHRSAQPTASAPPRPPHRPYPPPNCACPRCRADARSPAPAPPPHPPQTADAAAAHPHSPPPRGSHPRPNPPTAARPAPAARRSDRARPRPLEQSLSHMRMLTGGGRRDRRGEATMADTERTAERGEYREMLRHGTMSLGLYAPREIDRQQPHTQDEVYIVAAGRGAFLLAGQRFECGPRRHLLRRSRPLSPLRRLRRRPRRLGRLLRPRGRRARRRRRLISHAAPTAPRRGPKPPPNPNCA